MKLKTVRIVNYRSVEDSGDVPIEQDVTCLVGKNESGKTSFLQAMYKAKPIEDSATYDEVIDFPSRLTKKRNETTDAIPVAYLTFELGPEELGPIQKEFGSGLLDSTELGYTAWYRRQPKATYSLTVNQSSATSKLRESLVIDDGTDETVTSASTVAQLLAALKKLEAPNASQAALISKIESWRDHDVGHYIYDTYIEPLIPRFVYFDEYDSMPGKVSIPDLIKRRDADLLTRGERSLIALLDIVSVSLEDFNDQSSHERLIREIENAANSISDEVFEYWSQNTDLAVRLVVLTAEPGANAPLNQGPILDVRVVNSRHRVSVPFDDRSRGFVWFFSFLAYFSQVKEADKRKIILLLDEPGLSLHATAQGDLLRFVDEKLATKHQVVYTTHSPFMIAPSHLERVRTVVDVDTTGSKISSDFLDVDAETVFPLQAALGYTLAQTLFLGQDNLLIEGPSDLLYLEVMNEYLRESGRTTLDQKWVLVPVRGAGKLATFVTLLGSNKMNCVVLKDAGSGQTVSVDVLVADGRFPASNLITIGGVLRRTDADIEDMFDVSLYLEFVNLAYATELGGTKIQETDLDAGNRITKRIQGFFAMKNVDGGRFNHYRPALAMLRNELTVSAMMTTQTLDNFENLAAAINPLLSS